MWIKASKQIGHDIVVPQALVDEQEVLEPVLAERRLRVFLARRVFGFDGRRRQRTEPHAPPFEDDHLDILRG